MTVEDSLEFFESIPSIYPKLKTLNDVGLGYLRLGQSSTTLIRWRSATRKTYLPSFLKKIPAKPSTYSMNQLPVFTLKISACCLDVLNRLVEKGNTVLVIEHNLDVIKVADHIIDIGPKVALEEAM
jgi:excinuclease ABC subunit A